MEFRILGPLEVSEDGRPLPLGGGKQRALLAVLLLHANEVVPRDALIDALWGGRPPDTAATALQVHVSQLRKLLDPRATRGDEELLVTRAPGYVLRVEPEQLDLWRFERLLDQGKAALQRGEPQSARATLGAALVLWRGPPLADLDSLPFARQEGLRLEDLRLSAVEERIEADLALGRHADLVSELNGLVSAHPLRERLRGQLMLALYRCGRQADALDVYQKGRRLLVDELGLEPGEALQRLERAILNQAPELAPPAPPPPAPAAPDASVPTGTVTFLFTDIEGSTRLVQRLGDDYGALLEQHRTVLRDVFGRRGGQEIDSQGDAFFFAFRRARDAVAAAVDAQRRLDAEQWPHDAAVRIRIGIHTGEPGVAGAGYHGIDVVRAARISGVAGGGQILVSSATRDLVGDRTLPDVSFRDLGEHRLKDIDRPQGIFQVVAPGLGDDFPPLRPAGGARVLPVGGREEQLAAAAGAAVEAEEGRVRFSRRARVAAAVGALLLAGAVTAAVVQLRSGAEAPVVVSPDSVAAIDPDTNRVQASIPVGSRPVAVAVGDGALWVANADDGTVSRIDPKTRTVGRTFGLGADVSDIAVYDGVVWVAGGNDGTLIRIDPQLDAVEATVDFGGTDALVPQPVFLVAAGPEGVWVGRGDQVVRIDPATNDVIAQVDVSGPAGLTVGGGAAWVAASDGRVIRIDAVTNEATVVTSLPSGALAPVFGAGSLWLIVPLPTGVDELIRRGEIWRLSPESGIPTATTTPGAFPIDLALADGALWVANHEDGSVSRIDGETARVVATVAVGHHPNALAIGEGTVWVSVEREGFGF